MAEAVAKAKTGIAGLDEITGGGLPQGRPTLLCGGAGSGKTLLAMTFLLEGALRYGEPGVFVCFEETEKELASNVASLGYDVDALVAEKKFALDYVRVERNEIEETGEYDLEGLFVRIGLAIDEIGAKRVALDTIEALFSGFSNLGVLRAELRRLFRWLKDRGVTAIITGERGDGSLTRHALEEYVSDCVILLDHRVIEQVATRRLRIVKYRGSEHGTNEYPFLIDAGGISVLPVTSLELAHSASSERIVSGVPGLDEMLGGVGFWRASSILVSGGAGGGKTTLAAQFVEETCRRGERALFFAFEESPSQLVRNMLSVGIDLKPGLESGALRFVAARPCLTGLEMHLARMHREVEQFLPHVVVIDPILNFGAIGSVSEVRSMLLRLIDFLKSRGITALFTAVDGSRSPDREQAVVSSLMDAWVQVQMIEGSGERNRALYVIKARGIAHSNQLREFVLTDHGVVLREAYLGLGGVVTGAARIAQELRESEVEAERRLLIAGKTQEIERKRREIAIQIAALEAELADEESKADLFFSRQRAATDSAALTREGIARNRGGGASE